MGGKETHKGGDGGKATREGNKRDMKDRLASVREDSPDRTLVASCQSWAVTFIPMPMPKTVCTTNLYNKTVQLEVCRTFPGRGMGMNISQLKSAVMREDTGFS